MININCPCCHNTLKECIGTVILDNIKQPLNKDCVICLSEMNSVDNTEQLVSCPKCGNLFHNNCWFEYVTNQMKHLLLIILMFIIQIDITSLTYYI